MATKTKASASRKKQAKQSGVTTIKHFALIHDNDFGITGQTFEELMQFIRHGNQNYPTGGCVGFWSEKTGYKNFGVKKTDTAETIIKAIVKQSGCWRLFQVEVIVKQ